MVSITTPILFEQIADNEWLVESSNPRTRAGAGYKPYHVRFVEGEGYACTCPHYEFRNQECKHCEAVSRFVARRAIDNKNRKLLGLRLEDLYE